MVGARGLAPPAPTFRSPVSLRRMYLGGALGPMTRAATTVPCPGPRTRASFMAKEASTTWSIESIREAALTPADIFSLYTDPSTWGSWGHNTRGAHADGPVVEGSIVHVEAGYRRTWEVLVLRMKPDRLIETEVRPPGLTVVQRFEVEPTESGVRIRHEIEVSGMAAGFTRLTMKPVYQRWLEKETRQLVEFAQQRQTGGMSAIH